MIKTPNQTTKRLHPPFPTLPTRLLQEVGNSSVERAGPLEVRPLLGMVDGVRLRFGSKGGVIALGLAYFDLVAHEKHVNID